MTTIQCQICKKSIKDVSWDRAWEWLDFHKCFKKVKKPKKSKNTETGKT